MKNLLFVLSIILVLTSCTKEEYIPMEQVEEVQDTTAWQDTYSNGGTLTTTGGTTEDNELKGTTWILTKVVSSFATEYPNDTIEFVKNTKYTWNSGAERGYQLSSVTSSTNYDLSLYYFAPFGGSHYSAQVGYYFVDDAELNNIEFEDTQNPGTTIRAWFVKQ